VRVAILGCGSIGRRHSRNVVSLAHPDVCLYDMDSGRGKDLAAELSVNAAATLDDVWAWRPSVAIVATPSFLHVPLALEAARRGCDLFVEKPLGSTLKGIPELLAEARARQLVTLVGCNMRFHPGPATVKRLLEERGIGDVISARLQTGSYLPAWRPDQDYRAGYSASVARGGGALLDCIHEIDLALWYFGRARLSAAVVRPAVSLGLDADGFAELLLEHENGVVSSVHLNFVQRDYRRSCQVIGSTGTIYWDFADNSVVVRRGEEAEAMSLPAGWQPDQMYVDEMTHFLDCVSSRRATTAPLDEGRAALEIALAARARSTAVGGSVSA
jgi:predicted dehydrogenase